MRITGDGIWGPPEDRDQALAVLRRLPELGVDFIDTADSYGPHVSEELIGEALSPYDGITVATKAGLVRTGRQEWHPVGRPAYLRQQLETSLWRLRTDVIDLWQLHRIDPDTPREEQFAVLADAKASGKVRHVGLSEVSVEEIEAARELGPHGVTVNCVAPGPIDTDIMGGTLSEERKAEMAADVLVGRIGTPGEVAALMAFLLGPDAGFITAATYDINGGLQIS